MRQTHKWLASVLVALEVVLLGSGCGTIRGRPPAFDEKPPELPLADFPEPPAIPQTNHLGRELKFLGPLSQQEGGVAKRQLIYYPGLRQLTVEEVVNVKAVAKGSETSDAKLKDVFIEEVAKNPKSFLAVIDLKNESAQAAASGRLAADFLYREIRAKAAQVGLNIRILDRDSAYREILGDAALKEGMLGYETEELVAKTKALGLAAFLMSGAVTTYSIENREVDLDYVINTNSYVAFQREIAAWRSAYARYRTEFTNRYVPAYRGYVQQHRRAAANQEAYYQRYQRQYQDYVQSHESYQRRYQSYFSEIHTQANIGNLLFFPIHAGLSIITFGGANTWARTDPYPMIRREPMDPMPPIPPLVGPGRAFRPDNMPERVDEDALVQLYMLSNRWPRPARRMATVCNVGITVRMVSGINAEILWIGNGTIRSTDLQWGMQEVCAKLVEKLFEDCGY